MVEVGEVRAMPNLRSNRVGPEMRMEESTQPGGQTSAPNRLLMRANKLMPVLPYLPLVQTHTHTHTHQGLTRDQEDP